MLTQSTRGTNVTEDEMDTAIAMAHLQMALRMQSSLLECLKTTQAQLKNVRSVFRDRSQDAGQKYQSVKHLLAAWDKEQTKLINDLKKEITALHGMQHLATIDPLTATRH